MDQNNKHYRFAAIADVHIDWENGGKNIYFINAEQNLTRALEVIGKCSCGFIVSAGDTVTNAAGAEEEWQRYQRIINSSGYAGTVFEAMGNHETRYAKYGGCTIEDCRREFIRFTRLSEKPITRPPGKTYYAYTDDMFGDAFLFLSLENGVDVNLTDNFSDEQMDWAEEQAERFFLEKRRVFVIQHSPIYGFGAGDNCVSPAYKGSIRLESDTGKPFVNNRRFYKLIRRYRDMIWLSGHTHVDFRDRVNYVKREDSCHMLHIPALAGSTRLIGGKKTHVLDRTFYGDAAQGYLADVYENRVVFRGIDFLTDTVYSDCIYTIHNQ